MDSSHFKTLKSNQEQKPEKFYPTNGWHLNDPAHLGIQSAVHKTHMHLKELDVWRRTEWSRKKNAHNIRKSGLAVGGCERVPLHYINEVSGEAEHTALHFPGSYFMTIHTALRWVATWGSGWGETVPTRSARQAAGSRRSSQRHIWSLSYLRQVPRRRIKTSRASLLFNYSITQMETVITWKWCASATAARCVFSFFIFYFFSLWLSSGCGVRS